MSKVAKSSKFEITGYITGYWFDDVVISDDCIEIDSVIGVSYVIAEACPALSGLDSLIQITPLNFEGRSAVFHVMNCHGVPKFRIVTGDEKTKAARMFGGLLDKLGYERY